MRISKSLEVFAFCFIIGALNISAQGKQTSQDTTYYQDYSDKLLLRIYTITKFNSLTIENTETGQSLKLLPNGQTNLGVGFNYKHFGLGLAFGAPISTGTSEKYGKTKRLDVQGSMYGYKFGGDGPANVVLIPTDHSVCVTNGMSKGLIKVSPKCALTKNE